MMHSLTAINTNVIPVVKWKFGIAKKKKTNWREWDKDRGREIEIEIEIAEEYGI